MIRQTFVTALSAAVVVCTAASLEASQCSVVPFDLANYGQIDPVVRGVMMDFDGDGKPDIAAATAYNVQVGYSKINPFWTVTTLAAPSGAYTDIAAADFDGVKGPDVVATNTAANLVVIGLNTGDSFTVSTIAISQPSRIVAGDFNGDGKADFLVASATGVVTLFAGNGNGTFSAPAVLFTLRAAPTAFTVADVNGDGKLDLLAGYAGVTGIDLMIGNGNGTFRPAMALPAGNSVFDIAAADVNGDGKVDVITANNDDGTISVLPGHGDGTFGAPATYSSAPWPAAIAIADMNGDHLPDIVVENDLAGFVIHRNLGDGTFTAKPGAPHKSTERRPTAFVFAADLDGDGRVDLIGGPLHDSVVYNRNVCGLSNMLPATSHRTLNPGQTVDDRLDVAPVGVIDTVAPTGTITFKEGTTILGTATLSPHPWLVNFFGGSLTTSFATTGTHHVNMEYSGDENYDAKTVSLDTIVTSVTNSISINVSPNPTVYDAGYGIAPTVMTSDGTKVTGGGYSYTVDGIGGYGWTGLIAVTGQTLPAGTHTLIATYNGDDTHAPSGPSAPVTLVIAKATPQFSATLQSVGPLKAVVEVRTAKRATGTVFVRENSSPRGSSSIDTQQFPSATVTIPIDPLPPGKHKLDISYSGDGNVNGASTTITLTVPGTPPPPKRRSAPH